MRLTALVEFIPAYLIAHPTADKEQLADAVAVRFALTNRRKLFVGADFAIRFRAANANGRFPNTIVGIAKIVAHDNLPLIICFGTPGGCRLVLANTTFIAKVSHSSQLFTETQLRGSINGSDIMRDYHGIANEPANFDQLWAAHAASDRAANLARIVAATEAIRPTAPGWTATEAGVRMVLHAPSLAAGLGATEGYSAVKRILDAIVRAKSGELLAAAQTDNVKDRGERIEALITRGTGRHSVGDIEFAVGTLTILVDVKSKLAHKNAAPKAWNIDKVLAELALGGRLLSMYFVLMDIDAETIDTRLISIFDTTLIAASGIQKHWSGRGTRGTIQFGAGVDAIWADSFDEHIDVPKAEEFLQKVIGPLPAQSRPSDPTWLPEVYAHVLAGRTDDASNTIYDKMDLLLVDGKLQEVDEVLQSVDLNRLDAATMLGFLTITSAARHKLPYRPTLYGQIEKRFLAEFPAERVKKILVGLA